LSDEPELETKVKLFPEQVKFFKACISGTYRFLLIGGSIRSAKTYATIIVLIVLCKMFAGSRWAIIRKDLPTLKRNTIPTIEKIAPRPFIGELHRTEYKYPCANGSEILLMAETYEKDPELNRFKGLEINGALFEQMEEIHQATFNMVATRIGQWKLPKLTVQPPALLLGNCNPTQSWLKRRFYDPWKKDRLKAPYYFQSARIQDNPTNTKEYLQSLRDVLPQEMYARYVDNQWDSIDEINQLVSWEIIYKCESTLPYVDRVKSLGVDVGREGPDPTVFVLMEGPNIKYVRKFPKTKINEVDEKVEQFMAEETISADHVCVDAVGLGAGVVDNLEKRHFTVIAMSGGAREIVRKRKVGTHFSFANWKAWSYWAAKKAMEEGQVGNFKNDILQSDCGAIKYFTKNDKEITVESKDVLRKRIGRSCDYWDAFVYANWARHHAELTATGSTLYTSAMLAKDLKAELEVEKQKQLTL